jgi:hypothetical protein
LYNLENDLSEKNNVAAMYQGIAKQSDAMITEAHKPDKKWPLLPNEF